MLFFVIDSVIESNAEMQVTYVTRASLSQQNIANLRIDIKKVLFDKILRLLIEDQLKTMRKIVLAVIIIKHFVDECDFST
jgi:hypothetical protein